MASTTGEQAYLLLLPPCPEPCTYSAVKAAFEDTLSQILGFLVTQAHQRSQAAIIDLAIACPHLINDAATPRVQSYAETMTIVQQLYKLVCNVSVQDYVDVTNKLAVDFKILLVAWDPNASSDAHTEISAGCGPVVTLSTLAASRRPWLSVIGDQTSVGDRFLQAFIKEKAYFDRPDNSFTAPSRQLSDSDKRLHKVAVGGTFDHLHIGHKLLLTMTAYALDPCDGKRPRPRTLIVGISADALLKNKKHAQFLQTWHERAQGVMTFLLGLLDFNPDAVKADAVHQTSCTLSNGLTIQCVELTDPCGPTITDPEISGLVLSAETRAGGHTVNEKRVEQGWEPLMILEVGVLSADDREMSDSEQSDFSSKLSSTEIRARYAMASHAKT